MRQETFTLTVTGSRGAITGKRMIMYMESRKDTLEFGVRELEVWIKY